MLFLAPDHLSDQNRPVQRDTVERLHETYPSVQTRFAETQLPWRGTLADHGLDYDSAEAVLLVKKKKIPLDKRQAAVTDNASFVAGLQRCSQLTWDHGTLSVDPYR